MFGFVQLRIVQFQVQENQRAQSQEQRYVIFSAFKTWFQNANYDKVCHATDFTKKDHSLNGATTKKSVVIKNPENITHEMRQVTFFHQMKWNAQNMTQTQHRHSKAMAIREYVRPIALLKEKVMTVVLVQKTLSCIKKGLLLPCVTQCQAKLNQVWVNEFWTCNYSRISMIIQIPSGNS